MNNCYAQGILRCLRNAFYACILANLVVYLIYHEDILLFHRVDSCLDRGGAYNYAIDQCDTRDPEITGIYRYPTPWETDEAAE